MESQLPSRFSRCRNDGSNKTFAIINLTNAAETQYGPENPGERRSTEFTEEQRGQSVSYLEQSIVWFNTGQVNISQNCMYDFMTIVSPRDPVNPAAMSREQIEAVLQFVAKSLRIGGA